MEARDNTMQDNINEMVGYHLGIDIESIDIVQILLDNTCLPEITDLLEGPVQQIVVAIVLPNSILHFFIHVISVSISLPSHQHFPFHALTKISKLLLLVCNHITYYKK